MTTFPSDGYSSHVVLQLRANGREYAVAQVARDFVIMGEACELPLSTKAEIIVTVDGREKRRRVILAGGTNGDQHVVKFLSD
jgi:hypothetical protein